MVGKYFQNILVLGYVTWKIFLSEISIGVVVYRIYTKAVKPEGKTLY